MEATDERLTDMPIWHTITAILFLILSELDRKYE